MINKTKENFQILLEFVDERLEKGHQSDPELVSAHNADPKNAAWKIDPDEPFELTKVSSWTATRNLADLVRNGILRQHGRGKGSYFELTR